MITTDNNGYNELQLWWQGCCPDANDSTLQATLSSFLVAFLSSVDPACGCFLPPGLQISQDLLLVSSEYLPYSE